MQRNIYDVHTLYVLFCTESLNCCINSDDNFVGFICCSMRGHGLGLFDIEGSNFCFIKNWNRHYIVGSFRGSFRFSNIKISTVCCILLDFLKNLCLFCWSVSSDIAAGQQILFILYFEILTTLFIISLSLS